MKMKKWSSQWTQFMRCSTNWAMKPLTLEAGQLWVHMFLWKKWVLMIYEINHIWTAVMKWRWRNDRHSELNLCNCMKNPEKNSGLQRGLNPWPRDYRCDALAKFTCSQRQWLYSSNYICKTLDKQSSDGKLNSKIRNEGSKAGSRFPPVWPGFKYPPRRHVHGLTSDVGSVLCSERFFSGCLGFPLPSKTNSFKF